MIKNFYYVHILLSLKGNRFYIGFTKNINRRILEHNQGKNISTKHRAPLNLIYFEGYLDKDDAIGREIFLKSGSGHRYINKQLRNYLAINNKA